MKVDAVFLVQRAIWAGQHALPLYFMMLALLLVATYACWWLLRRYTMLARQSSLSPTFLMGLGTAIGFELILACAGGFVELAGQLKAGETLGRADQALTDALGASMPRPALQAFAALTRLGDTATISVLCIRGSFAAY